MTTTRRSATTRRRPRTAPAAGAPEPPAARSAAAGIIAAGTLPAGGTFLACNLAPTARDFGANLDLEPARPDGTDGHFHDGGIHYGWLGHHGHAVHCHDARGRTYWYAPGRDHLRPAGDQAETSDARLTRAELQIGELQAEAEALRHDLRRALRALHLIESQP